MDCFNNNNKYQEGKMLRGSQNEKRLNILCIGDVQAGKTNFLKKYTNTEQAEMLQGAFQIYVKKINDYVIYLCELSSQELLYLETNYDGIIFFLDLAGAKNVRSHILKWVQKLSNYSKQNVFKIPLKIMVINKKQHRNQLKWRKALENDLESLVQLHQVIYLETFEAVENPLFQFFHQIILNKALGIKSTFKNDFRLYGLNNFTANAINYAKLNFFRCIDTLFAKLKTFLPIMKTKIND